MEKSAHGIGVRSDIVGYWCQCEEEIRMESCLWDAMRPSTGGEQEKRCRC